MQIEYDLLVEFANIYAKSVTQLSSKSKSIIPKRNNAYVKKQAFASVFLPDRLAIIAFPVFSLNFFHGLVEPVAGEELDRSFVAGGGKLDVHWDLSEDGEIPVLGDFWKFAFAENREFFAAVRADGVAHVLDDSEDGDLHEFRHVHGFADDHGDEFLRRGDDDDAVNGQGLEDCQGNVAGSRRHVHEHAVDVAPDDVGPELFYDAGYDWPAPDDRVGLPFHQEIHWKEPWGAGGRRLSFQPRRPRPLAQNLSGFQQHCTFFLAHDHVC